ncbi:ATP-binding cassette domain-containing protein, partial [Vibrio parahaemolyticus]|nr:ATP-binding cassette domain-containing protein [Vibrio parahaemolyticus]
QKMVLQQAMFEKQQKQMSHMQSYIDRFRYKASKARQAQSRIKALERMEKVLPAQFDNPFSFQFREPAALPNPIMMMDEVSAGYGDNLILEKIRLNLVPGSRIGLLGRNGAGKSTLIELLFGLRKPTSGEVYVCGYPLSRSSAKQRQELCQHIQLIPQEPQSSLNPYYTVRQILLEPLSNIGLTQELNEKVEKVLADVGLDLTLLDRNPQQLS